MKKIQQKTETNPLSVLRQAICGVTPDIAVKARRVGGSTQQVRVNQMDRHLKVIKNLKNFEYKVNMEG